MPPSSCPDRGQRHKIPSYRLAICICIAAVTSNISTCGDTWRMCRKISFRDCSMRPCVFTCVSSYAKARLSYCLSVCLSVRQSVTRWYCIKTAEHIVMLSSPHDSTFILVLCVGYQLSRSSRIPTGSLPAGPLNIDGV